MAKKDKSEYIIQAVSHALDLLEQFHGEVDELGVTELSKRLKLHKNNVFRLLATLESRGYIEQNRATENYRLGLKSLELGQTFVKQMGLLRQARPILDRIVQECNETAYVAIFKEGYVVYLDVVETDLTVRVVSQGRVKTSGLLYGDRQGASWRICPMKMSIIFIRRMISRSIRRQPFRQKPHYVRS